jgi:hypothetical protein
MVLFNYRLGAFILMFSISSLYSADITLPGDEKEVENDYLLLCGYEKPLVAEYEPSFVYGYGFIDENGKEDDVNACDVNGKTLLLKAVEERSLNLANRLLVRGADVNISDKKGCSPLGLAACVGDVEMVKILLKYRAQCKQKNSAGYTPLWAAASSNHVEVLQVLLDHDPLSVDIQDNVLRTPLHMAIKNGHLESIRVLLEAGADKNVKNAQGDIAFSMTQKLYMLRRFAASIEKGEEIIRLLRSVGPLMKL